MKDQWIIMREETIKNSISPIGFLSWNFYHAFDTLYCIFSFIWYDYLSAGSSRKSCEIGGRVAIAGDTYRESLFPRAHYLRFVAGIIRFGRVIQIEGKQQRWRNRFFPSLSRSLDAISLCGRARLYIESGIKSMYHGARYEASQTYVMRF